MSGLKRIIPGNRIRSPAPAAAQSHVKVPSSPRKNSFFHRPHRNPASDDTQPRAAPLENSECKPYDATHQASANLPSEATGLAHTRHTTGYQSKSRAASPQYSSPHAPGDLFRLGQLPAATDVNLEELLKQSVRHVTIKRAAAARYSVVTALANRRELSVLSGAIDEYLPYALTCWDIAENLKKKGTNILKGVTWSSGLLNQHSASVTYEGGFGLEAALVLTLSALCKVRAVAETARGFAMKEDHALVTDIKSLQKAAGMFDYARDEVTPKAMADFVGSPPPELVPEVSSLFSSMSLCLAQALHVRRAVLNGMSPATITKLSAAAKGLAEDVISKHDKVTRLGVSLTRDVETIATDMKRLTTGWTLQYFGASTPGQVDSGAKITSLRESISILTDARSSRILGQVAGLDLANIETQLDDAVSENRVMYQHVIPDAKELRLPPGRLLVSATKYEAIRIPMANTAPKK